MVRRKLWEFSIRNRLCTYMYMFNVCGEHAHMHHSALLAREGVAGLLCGLNYI